jgi:anti-anti-sigma factor
MNAPLHQLEVQERPGDIVLARLGGEIDRSNAPELCERLLQAARGRLLLLDLTDLEHLDSSGMGMLHALSEHSRLELIVSPTSIVARAIAIVEFDQLAPVHQTPPEHVSDGLG